MNISDVISPLDNLNIKSKSISFIFTSNLKLFKELLKQFFRIVLNLHKYIKKIIKDNLELYYSYKKKYDIILIEGKKNNNNNYYIHNLNIIF